jgi:hypothetical protein
MSRAGRWFVETTLDRVGPARRVAAALGLQPFEPRARLEWMLDDLNTPAAAPIRARAAAMLPA